jgi:hypothetical protein
MYDGNLYIGASRVYIEGPREPVMLKSSNSPAKIGY